ncbi:MAG: hypothetical protein HY288_01330 [Planctomycetia bacterium]|nr:hypothetical protein [Planctomycetia bacterium]
MHARELVEVAGMVALNGPLLVCGRLPPNSTHLEQYWSTSRCRFENWSRALKAYAALNLEDSRQDVDRWIEIRAALDEIFASEILTRVWSAVLVAHDRSAGANLAEPIARSVLASHMEARHRALALLVHGRGVSTPQAVALNRLRRRAERWTDMLVGGLLHLSDVSEFAVEPERAEDFAADLTDRRSHPGGLHAWRLTLVSLRNAFRTGLSPLAANPDANARITASILGCFPADLFDSTGLFQSLWMLRLAANASDAQGLISDLLRPGPQSRADQSAMRRKRRI